MLSGDNSILNRATTAKETMGQKQIEERVSLAYNAGVMEDINNGEGKLQQNTLNTELTKLFPGSTIEIDTTTDTTGKKWYVTIDGGTPIEVEAGKAGGEEDTGVKDKNGVAIKTTNETTPFLPNPSKNEIINNDLSTGLTIKDENQNEWVWVVVPKTVTKDATSDEEIETALVNYIKTDKDGNDFIDRESADTYGEGNGLSQSEYSTKKSAMLQSIKENGGFYIGKYETGAETARTNKDDKLTTAIIKQNAYPYIYVTIDQAEDMSEGLVTGERNCTLMFGIQWDLVLRYLNESGVSASDLTESSKNIGNCIGSEFDIDRGEYNNWDNEGRKLTNWKGYTQNTPNFVNNNKKLANNDYNYTYNGGVLLTTGAADRNNRQNIYDLAGNVYEWTLEFISYYSDSCWIYRGGYFLGDYSANNRGFGNASKSSYEIGFRATLY